MVKIVLAGKCSSKDFSLKSKGKDDVDHKAIHLVTSPRKSNAYKETLSANIPATYVSGGNVVKEIDGKRIVLKPVARSISVRMMVDSMKPISAKGRASCDTLPGTLIIHNGANKNVKKTSVSVTSGIPPKRTRSGKK